MHKKAWIVMGDSRIGRLRYIAYSFGLGLACLPLILLGGFVADQGHESLGIALTLAAQAIVCALNIMLTVRRLHDFNVRGWWAFLDIPLAFYDPYWIGGSPPIAFRIFLAVALAVILCVYVLILLCRPGSPGENRFGPAPPPNSVSVVAVAALAIIVPLVGFTILLIFQALA